MKRKSKKKPSWFVDGKKCKPARHQRGKGSIWNWWRPTEPPPNTDVG